MWSQSEENRSIRRGVGLSENFRHEIPESGQSFFVYSLIFPTLTFTKNMNSPTNHNTSPVPSVSYLVHLKSDPGVATEGGEPGSFRYAHEHPSVIVHTGQRLDVDPVLTRECHSCRVAKIRADPRTVFSKIRQVKRNEVPLHDSLSLDESSAATPELCRSHITSPESSNPAMAKAFRTILPLRGNPTATCPY